MIRIAAMFIAALTLVGCAPMQQQRPTVEIRAPFDAAHAAKLLQPGSNTIKGNGFLRQRGGGVVTCAGSVVRLVPATDYARQRIAYLYGGSGINSSRLNPIFVPDPTEYQLATKTTRCDAQGNFTFDRVADGEFYLTTGVFWQVGGTTQGGPIMHRAQVSGGETVTVVISGD